MKRFLLFVIIILGLTESQGNSLLAANDSTPDKTEAIEIVSALWQGIPDHGININTETSLTPEFYTLVDMGFSVPSDNPVGIGSEDFLWYWYTETDSGENDHIMAVDIDKTNRKEIKAKVKYQCLDEIAVHNIALERIDGKWLISDFDDMRQKITDYINTIGKQFLGSYAEEIIELPHIGGDMSDEDKEEYFEEVEAFRVKFYSVYPTGEVK